MNALRLAGKSDTEIGEAFGISRVRVVQVAGPRGEVLRAALSEAQRQAASDATDLASAPETGGHRATAARIPEPQPRPGKRKPAPKPGAVIEAYDHHGRLVRYDPATDRSGIVTKVAHFDTDGALVHDQDDPAAHGIPPGGYSNAHCLAMATGSRVPPRYNRGVTE